MSLGIADLSKSISPTAKSVIVIAVDGLTLGKSQHSAAFERHYFVGKGSSLSDGSAENLEKVNAKNIFSTTTDKYFSGLDGNDSIYFIVYPTRTYSEGFAGNLFAEVAPEDRSMFRKIKKRYGAKANCLLISLSRTRLFDDVAGYFSDEERAKYEREKNPPKQTILEETREKRPSFVEFNLNYIRNIKQIFASCITRPNKQDYFYLLTKTFGLNLVIRAAFAVKGVTSGQLPLMRAVISTSWYQLQDIVFTIYGQTYMKFLGKMTGLLRVFKAYFGDLFFVYFQLCIFEFTNRLLLGPLGENPLVYTWKGIGLIFANILQGIISGGPLTPAINKMRKVGLISHSTLMHLYQLGGLTLQFGLFASFGYQKIYACLTGGTLILSWSSYVICSMFFKDPETANIENADFITKLDRLVVRGLGQMITNRTPTS
jgi:hypothetical protein